MCGEQNGGQNGDRSGEDVAKGTGEMELCSVGNWGGDLGEGMAAYRWVQNCVCVRLVTGNTNSKI